MLICRTVAEVQETVAEWRRGGHTVALVPTMGNLHRGHLALLREAGNLADKAAASIFVNASQFDRQEDFDNYPRSESEDFEHLRQCGTALVFAPDNDEMYPSDFVNVSLSAMNLDALAGDLCGKHRPGHFQGVVSVLKRLFDIFAPDVAVFGEKDYQQQLLIRKMIQHLGLGIRVVAVPTVRDEDGLALSSRNAHLDAAQRSVAPRLYQVLTKVAADLIAGARDFESLSRQARSDLTCAGFQIDYFEIRTADLVAPTTQSTEFVVLAAVWLGKTRLIDNLSANINVPIGSDEIENC